MVGLVSAFAVLCAVDAGNDHERAYQAEAPGLTVDEPINIDFGVRMASALLDFDWQAYRKADKVPDHPPLGRVWIGLCHETAFLIWPPVNQKVPISIACARTGPALAFGATVFLVGWCAARWYGRFAGVAASLSLVLMPRMFGHAHLAALETCMNLAYAAVVLYLCDRWSGEGAISLRSFTNAALPACPTPSLRRTILGGGLLGLALLTKVQAVLLPIPVVVWALLVWRERAIRPLIIWGTVGMLVFYLGWPWLLDAPLEHLRMYLGRTKDRAVIYVWYFGQAIADRDVPWHYPWVLFLATVPIGLQLLGLVGLWGRRPFLWQTFRGGLLLSCLVFPLVVFSVPGVAVYDGERLFSVVFPLWAVIIGKGADEVRRLLSQRFAPRLAAAVLWLCLACQSYGLFVTAPCWLSYYNLAVGGLAGADRLGLQITYWGDSITPSLLWEAVRKAGDEGVVVAMPELTPGQWQDLATLNKSVDAYRVKLVPRDPGDARWLLLFRRKEYLPDDLRGPLDEGRIVASVRRDGVLLAVLYRLR